MNAVDAKPECNERTKPRHDLDQHDKAGDYTQWSRIA
jgi:hypothetical protein